MPSALTNRIIDEVARELVTRWKSITKLPLDSWYGLHFVAEEMGCQIELHPCTTSYTTDKHLPKPNGLAAIDREQSDMLIIRAAAHELGHHGLFWWTTFGWRWRWPAVFDMDINAFEEAICNCIADLIWALPERTQKNGKLAAPVSDGPILRCGWHNPIPEYMAVPAAEIEASDARENKDRATKDALIFD